MLKGFRDFILRGNVVELAVAVVIGAAFGALITAFVASFVTPLIALVGGKPDFTSLAFSISGTEFPYGQFITALVSFLIIAAVVYFAVVVPVNRAMERFAPKQPVDRETHECPECLSAIPVGARRCSFCTAEVSPAA